MLKTDKKRLAAFCLIVAILVFGVASWVAAQAEVSLIHACVSEPGSSQSSKNVMGLANTGSVRIVLSEADCRESERYVFWNQQGVQGETGPAGATGPAGMLTGDKVYIHYTGLWTILKPGASTILSVKCPDPDFAISGGYRQYGVGASYQVFTNARNLSDPGEWQVGVYNDGTQDVVFGIRAEVICVKE